MVDMRSGQVEYAVLQFGGLFGVGSDYYPLPWDVLTYDTEKGDFVIDLDKETLEKAPALFERRIALRPRLWRTGLWPTGSLTL